MSDYKVEETPFGTKQVIQVTEQWLLEEEQAELNLYLEAALDTVTPLR